MTEGLEKIVNHYGIIPQLKYLQSEVFELNEAILEYEILLKELHGFNKEADNELKQHITEEIADVMVMLEQIRIFYGISDMKVKDIMVYKIDRQLERIAGEKK